MRKPRHSPIQPRKDRLGQDLEFGDIVVYPTSNGRYTTNIYLRSSGESSARVLSHWGAKMLVQSRVAIILDPNMSRYDVCNAKNLIKIGRINFDTHVIEPNVNIADAGVKKFFNHNQGKGAPDDFSLDDILPSTQTS